MLVIAAQIEVTGFSIPDPHTASGRSYLDWKRLSRFLSVLPTVGLTLSKIEWRSAVDLVLPQSSLEERGANDPERIAQRQYLHTDPTLRLDAAGRFDHKPFVLATTHRERDEQHGAPPAHALVLACLYDLRTLPLVGSHGSVAQIAGTVEHLGGLIRVAAGMVPRGGKVRSSLRVRQEPD